MHKYLMPTLIPSPPGRHSKVSETMLKQVHVGRFFNQLLYEVVDEHEFAHWKVMSLDEFIDVAYSLGLDEMSETKLRSAYRYIRSVAPDLGGMSRYILFGSSEEDQVVWDTLTLSIADDVDPHDVVWRSPYAPDFKLGQQSEFIMSLAGGNKSQYEDILQTIAPLIMFRKPTGVVWWVGSGSNGKSSLVDSLYRIFPDQLAGLTLKQINDERDTPLLNGVLANVVRESSEGYIDDTANYKKIGTHEPFHVHKFHSQDSVLINGNLHHIFNANAVPTFNDKGLSARRRTIVIRFLQTFEDDLTFNDRTFTPENLSIIVSEMMRMAVQLKDQGYRYQFSEATLAVKQEQDAEANTAEEYGRFLIDSGIVAFESFAPLHVHYENWCLEMGYVALKIGGLRKAMKDLGFERNSYRDINGNVRNRYYLRGFDAETAVVSVGMAQQGLYRESGTHLPKTPEPVTTTVAQGQPTLGAEW